MKDIAATCRFYATVMGMNVETFGAGRHALTFGQQKINLHAAGHEIQPHASQPTPGSADLCFIAAVPLQEVLSHLHTCAVTIIEGPVERTGATGKIQSVYFRDPDQNLIEVSEYAEYV